MFETFNLQTVLEALGSYLTIRIGEVTFGPTDTSIFVLAVAAALLSAVNLWRIGQSEERQDRLGERLASVIDRAPGVRGLGTRWYKWIGRVVAASPAVGKSEQEKMLSALAAAGIKGHHDLASFIATKLCSAVAFAALTWLFLEWRQWFAGVALIRWGVLVGALMLGWRLPDFVLSRLAARRRQQIEQGIPDALDLLVICAEAGLSLDQAIEQVGQDLVAANPVVADEFAITAAEMRVLPDRGQALENLVRRTGLESLRSITATLSQAVRFGTPLAESLRVLAAEMRTVRLARIEERAARLPVLLAFPLMAFILPALFMVIGTPAVLRIADFFHNLTLTNPAGLP
jgi:tight adherence protein C